MGKGQDKSKRNRRKKTNAEKAALQNKKNATASRGAASLTSFYQSNRQEQDSVADTEQLPHEDDICEDCDDDAIVDNDIVLFSEEVDDGRDADDNEIVANLDVEDGEGDELDDDIEAEPDDCIPKKAKKRGIHEDYMGALYDRLKLEVAGKPKVSSPSGF